MFQKNLLILAVKQRQPEQFKSTHFETFQWPNGLTDKASDFKSEDWRFQSLYGRIFIF